MRKLIVEEWISLDGYVSDKEDRLDFFVHGVRASYRNVQRLEFLGTIDTIVMGRRIYNQFADVWPDRPTENDALAEKMNTAHKIVFSRTLNEAPWGQWRAAEIERRNLHEAIADLKSRPGSNIVVWGSIAIVQGLMQENLVDDYHLHLCPALTAGGRKFFMEELSPRSFVLVNATSEGPDIVHLHYQQKLTSE